MTCPHCQKELPQDYESPWCPFCGKNLDALASAQQELPRIKFKWQLFLCALLTPPLLTLLSAATMRFLILPDSMNENVTPFVSLIGGFIGGIICGVMLGFQGGSHLSTRVLLSIIMSVIMVPVCVVLCFFGCTFGGYQMRFD